MPINPVHCPVAHTDVFRITNLEGATIRIVCSEFEDATRTCRMKALAGEGGPLGRLLERAREGTLDAHDLRCVLA